MMQLEQYDITKFSKDYLATVSQNGMAKPVVPIMDNLRHDVDVSSLRHEVEEATCDCLTPVSETCRILEGSRSFDY